MKIFLTDILFILLYTLQQIMFFVYNFYDYISLYFKKK